MTTVHINAPNAIDRDIITAICPDCLKRTKMICTYYAWYGGSATCIRCGRNWEDGEWIPFEFYRYARRDSIAAAKRRYRRAGK